MRYDNYSPSIIRWNHSYPSHWACEKAKRYFANPKQLNKDNVESNILSLTLKGVIRNNGSKPIGLSPSDYATYQLFDENELVFKLIDLNNVSTSRVGIVPEKGIMSSAYIRFVPRTELNIKYFYYQYYDWYKRQIFNGLGEGVRQTLSGNDLRNLEILIPPRSEQDEIVRYLDWQVSKINKLIAAKKKEIAELRELEQSIIFHYVTRGVKENPSLKSSGINWAREIPNEWSILFLSQVAEEQCIKNKGMLEDNLLSLSYGRIITKDINTTEGLLPTSFEGYQIIYPGNVVLRLTDLQNDHKSLRTGLSREKGIITSAYTCLKVRDNILPEYLRLQLHAADLCKVFYGMGGGVRQSIGYKDIRRMLVFVPTVKEQEQIVATITEKCKPIQNCCEAKNAEVEILQELKTRLISDVVTGQIDVRGIEIPDYEYVEEESDEESDETEGADEEAEEQEE
jgi:type I restriction enzyme S subunit